MSNQWPGTTRDRSLVDGLNPRNPSPQAANVALEGDILSQVEMADASSSSPEATDVSLAEQPASLADRIARLETQAPPGKILPAQEGWRASVRRASGGLIKLGPGKDELARRKYIASIQQVFPRPVCIMVANPGGGEGKSPTTMALGATFGTRSEHAVLAWDNNETMGTLAALAMNENSNSTVTDLLEALPRLGTEAVRSGDIRAFTRHQGDSRFSVLASHHDPARMQMITETDFAALLQTVQRFWNVTVLDTGNNTIAENWLAALDVADQLVIPMHLTGKGQRSVLQMVQQLDTMSHATGKSHYRELYERAVVVLVPGRNADAKAARKMRSQLIEIFGPLATFIDAPFEPQLASGSTVDWQQVRPATVRAYEKIAAAVADGANTWAKTHS